MNVWLIEDEDEALGYEASDKEVESDLESTTRSKPKRKKLKKTAKAIPDRTFCNCLSLLCFIIVSPDVEDMTFDVYALPCFGLVLFVMALFIHAL
ncbi:hypothetical protein Tco_0245577 [Tanacetum coccineum]